mgnify:CR=1 FL=1
MDKILTVSIAAYNVEKTIEECLDSFLPSRYFDDLEILVINDGSNDNTANIVSKYEKKYPDTIHLINKVNGGHGSTLNKSLELATGKFYKAVDGDDWVDTKELDKLCDCLKNTNADLVVDNNYKEVYPDHTRLISLKTKYIFEKIYQFDELFQLGNNYEDNLFVLQISTVRTQCLRDVDMKIQEHCFYVDTELYFYIGLSVQKVLFLDSCTYRYRLSNSGQSVSAEGYYNHIEDLIKVEKNLLHLYSLYEHRIKSRVRREYLFSIVDTRYSMLFGCYTKIIQRADKDYLFVDFLQYAKEEYPLLLKKMHLSLINRYIEANPVRRIQLIRCIRKTLIFKILRKIKNLLKLK